MIATAKVVASAVRPEAAVVIAGGGPTGLMLAAELPLAKIDVAIVERTGTSPARVPAACIPVR